MTEEWKALNDDQKVQYDQMSGREKDRYEREMKVYREKMAREAPPAAEKEEKIAGKKRPASSTPQKSKAKEEKKGKEAPAKK